MVLFREYLYTTITKRINHEMGLKFLLMDYFVLEFSFSFFNILVLKLGIDQISEYPQFSATD